MLDMIKAQSFERELKDKAQIDRKYLQYAYLIKEWYPKYTFATQ